MSKKAILMMIMLLAAPVAARAADEGWRLVSVPCWNAGANAGALFSAQPLQVYELTAAGSYVEPGSAVTPGKGYWVYFDSEPLPLGGCMTVSYPSADIDIKPGWNMIGNPFIKDASLPDGWPDAYEYLPEASIYARTRTLEPWRGYFIKSPASCAGGCALTIGNPDYKIMGARADAPKVTRVVSCPLSGDTDGNYAVNASDLFPISQYYGTVITASTAASIAKADTDGNGIVDASDLFAVSRNYGDTCTGGITNSPPVAVSQAVSTSQDVAVTITLSGTDPEGSALTYAIVSNPAHGTLTTTSLPTVAYTPASGYYGSDAFTFRVSDGSLNSLSAAVSITISQTTIPAVAMVTNVTVTPDTNRRFSSLLVRWDPPTDTTINAFDIYCNDELVNNCPEMLRCFSGMSCDPTITYSYHINVPSLAGAPADPSNFECEVSIRAFVIDDTTDLIAKQSELSAAVAASTFAHTADSPYAGGSTSKEGVPDDCSALRSQGRIANSGSGSTVVLPNARIQAWRKETSSESPNGTLVATVYSNEQGYYEFSSLDPGYYNFIAYHDNDTSQTDDDVYSILESINIQPAPFNEGGFNNLGEMKLEETGSIYGRVKLALDSTGDNLLATPDDAYLGIDVYIPGTSFTAKTNRSGEFYILYLPPATYSLVSVADNYALVQTDGIEVESKQITTVTPDIVLLASIGSVIGTATFSDSSNNGDASVALVRDGSPGTVYTTSTLTDGSFTFSGIATGTYTLSINRYGWQPYTQSSVVESNSTTDMGEIGPIARIPGPSISGISPTSGVNDGSTTITIDGSYFATATVFYIKKGLLEAQLGSITYVSDTRMTAVVPSGYDWGAYDIEAVNPDTQSVTLSEVFNVTLPAPTLSSLSVSGMDNSVSLELTITGSKLKSGVTIRIGTTQTSNTTVNAAGTSLTTTVPAGIAPGTYSVTATNPDSAALTATLSNAFTVKALSLIQPEPSTLSIMSGDTRQFAATCSFTDSATTTTTICTDDVLWYSSDPNVGTITVSGGLFTAVNYGAAHVTAQRGSITSSQVPVAVYNPTTIFLDTGIYYGTGNDYQSGGIAADLDGDGDYDMINSNDGTNKIFLNNGAGTLAVNGQATCVSSSSNAQSIGVADFNGDSYLDVVCDGFKAGYGSYTFGFKNTNGDATVWAVTTSWDLGARQHSIAVGDFNMDGRLDWAAGASGSLNIFFSDGDGTFTFNGQETLATTDDIWSLAAGDIDSDGDTDLAAGNWGAANRVWLNDGDGLFTDSGQSLGSYRTRVVLLSDFDADGDLDIFEGNGGYSLAYAQPDRIWLNNGSGSFTDSGQSLPSTLTTAASAVDIDNDGDTDIIIGVGQGGFNLFYLNDGSGAFTDSGQRLSPTYTNNIVAADFNADSKIDFAEGTLSGLWFFTGGHGGIPANSAPTAPTILSESVIDVEGDLQYNDVTLTWNSGSDSETPSALLTYNISVVRTDGVYLRSYLAPAGPGNAGQATAVTLKNVPIGAYRWRVQAVDTGYNVSDWSVDRTFTTGMKITSSGNVLGAGDTGAIVAADIDGDGDADIIEGRNAAAAGSNIVWLNTGAGSFSQYSTFGSGDTTAMAAADIDGDEDIDIIEGTSGRNYVWLNNGDGSFADSEQDIGSGDTADIAIADFDLDGDPDIFVADSGSASYIYKNTGGAFTTGPQVCEYAAIGGVDTRDINNDGAPDLIIAAMSNGVVYYTNDGNGLLGYWRYDSTTRDATDVSIADVIGDDLLADVYIGLDNYFTQMLRNNVTYFIGNYISNDKMKTTGLDIADMDVDGDIDLVVLNRNQPAQILLNGGAFTYEWIDQSSLPDPAASDMALADIDGDVDIDVVVAVADGYNSSYDLILLNSQVKTNTAPQAPAAASVTENGNFVILTWDAGADSETETDRLTYDVKIKERLTSTWLRPAAPEPSHGSIGATRTLILHNAPEADYEWFVRAIDSGMLASGWTEGPNFHATADTDPPAFSGIQSATNKELSQTIELAWNAAADTSQPVTYNVYMATTSGGQNFSAPDYSTYGASITITGLTDDQEYCFVVRAADSANPPNEDTNTTELCEIPTPDVTAPTFAGLTDAQMGTTPGAVDLTWNAAADTNGPVVYNIYYSTTSGGQNFSAPNATTTSDSGMTLSGLTQLQTYYFVVRAMDASPSENEDANSVEMSAAAMGIPKVLLVDGDDGAAYESYFKTALDNAGISYAYHDREILGTVTSSTLADYLGSDQIVIWFFGFCYSQSYCMNSTEQADVISFLNSGGKLFITGQDFGYGYKSTTLYTYLGASGDYEDGGADKATLVSVPGDPISDALSIGITGGDGAGNQNYPSYINLAGSGVACLFYSDGVKTACSRNDTGTYKSVYFPFGFEGINAQADRDTVMERIYNWLTQ